MGLSQEQLAEKLGLTSQAVSKWECMQSIPDIYMLAELTVLFGITADKLLFDKDPEAVYVNDKTEDRDDADCSEHYRRKKRQELLF